jgi:hypothetical protein
MLSNWRNKSERNFRVFRLKIREFEMRELNGFAVGVCWEVDLVCSVLNDNFIVFLI